MSLWLLRVCSGVPPVRHVFSFCSCVFTFARRPGLPQFLSRTHLTVLSAVYIVALHKMMFVWLRAVESRCAVHCVALHVWPQLLLVALSVKGVNMGAEVTVDCDEPNDYAFARVGLFCVLGACPSLAASAHMLPMT